MGPLRLGIKPPPRNTVFSRAANVVLAIAILTVLGSLIYRVWQPSRANRKSALKTRPAATASAAPSDAAIAAPPLPLPPPVVDAAIEPAPKAELDAGPTSKQDAKSDIPEAAAQTPTRKAAPPPAAPRPKQTARPRPRSKDDDIGF